MTESDATHIMQQLAARYAVPSLAADEFTVQMFADEHGRSYNEAVTILRRALADGAVEKIGKRRMLTGHTAHAYRVVCNK